MTSVNSTCPDNSDANTGPSLFPPDTVHEKIRNIYHAVQYKSVRATVKQSGIRVEKSS